MPWQWTRPDTQETSSFIDNAIKCKYNVIIFGGISVERQNSNK